MARRSPRFILVFTQLVLALVLALGLAPTLALALARTAAAAPAACPALPPRAPMPIEATPGIVEIPEWRERVALQNRQLAERDLSAVRLVFIGDSITESWEPTMWRLFWGGLSPLNLGQSGDLTQGVLWRLNHGQWGADLKPEVAVVLIGTNNAGWNSRPEDTALGIAEILRFIRDRSPRTKVLLLGILPRGGDASAPERAINQRVNALIKRCADGENIVYLDPGSLMIDKDGRLSDTVMYDLLHPTMVGYAILGGRIADRIHQMMLR